MSEELEISGTLDSAQLVAIEDRISDLVSSHGEATPDQIVNAARSLDSPLHGIFEWDDTKAAEEHRLHQARQLIRTIVVRPFEKRQSEKFTLSGSGREIRIITRPVIMRRDLPPLISSSTPPREKVEEAPSRTQVQYIPPPVSPISLAPLAVSPTKFEDEVLGEPATVERLRTEVQCLSEAKSRLVKIPEAIDIARDLRMVIEDLKGLLGRLGKTCSKCCSRNAVYGDGHKCISIGFSTGTSNLGSAR